MSQTIITMETGKAPHVARGTKRKNMQRCTDPSVDVGGSVCACIPCGAHSTRGSSDSVEAVDAVQFTWPCPRPQTSLLCPSGTPVSANLSSSPATRSKAPLGERKQMFLKHLRNLDFSL